jgi:small neutral amino acid transporter SnatA (MarC family)
VTHTAILTVLGFLLAANPLHRRPRMPLGEPFGDTTRANAVIAAAGGAVVLVLCALVGGPVLDAASISVPNGRVAAGVVLLGAALVQLVPQRQWDTATPTRSEALVPGLFPVVLRPELVVLALVAGADVGWLAAAVGVLVAMAATVGYVVPRGGGSATRVEYGVVVLAAVALVVLAVDLIADGVLAV